jgi:hypothetical protein
MKKEEKGRQAFKFYRSYFEVYKEIQNPKDKLNFIEAILERQFYGVEPELNGIAKFAYISQKHSIDKQIDGYETKTGKILKRETHPPIKDPMQGSMQGSMQDPLIQEKEKEKEKEKEEQANVFNFKKSLLDLGIDVKIADDWLKVRKQKKAVNTETSFNKLKNEISKTRLSANDCIKICVEKSWAGFSAEWVESISPRQETPEEAYARKFADSQRF